MTILALLLLPFAALPLILLAGRAGRRAVARVAGAAMLGGVLLLVAVAPAIMGGETILLWQPWLGAWGFDLSLRLDGLGFLFALLIYGIGALIVLYAYYYMEEGDGLVRFLGTLLAFAGGMLGVVLAENVLLMLLFWEVTSLTSFLLIAYKYPYHDSRIAARMALAVTGGGGLALLAGLLLLGRIAGSFELSVILDRGDIIRAHPLYAPMLLLVLIGAFTKSAQFPFHFWLPNAMAAPTPVSAYLHSATMVKAGVFLLARLYPALSGSDLWFFLVTGTGAVTLLLGAYLALLKHDFKGLLAYSTISHLGLITMLFGLDTRTSAIAGIFHIINHAVFKASLFMVAGVIDKQCGTRDMRRINGLARYMPVTATLGIVAAGAMAGVPFLNGFLSKEMFFTEALAAGADVGAQAWLLPAVATVAGVLAVGYSARFVHDVFFNGEPVDLPRMPTPPPRIMRLPMEILVAIVVIVGVAPQLLVADLLSAASAAVLQAPPPPVKLAVWHGFNLPLVMSIVALGGGIYYYWKRDRLFTLHERYALDFSSPVAFERVYNGMALASRRLVAALDRQTLAQHVSLFLGAVLLLGLWAWTSARPAGAPLVGSSGIGRADPPVVLGALVLIFGAVGATIFHRQRLLAVILASVVGLAVSLAFVRFAAPDLAITQLSVELATILLFLLALRFLPAEAAGERGRAAPLRDALLAAGAGVGAAVLALAMMTRPFATISAYHVAKAKPEGGGTNVVNVILVDFRGFDTLGEIAVLALAALGVHALLERLKPRGEAAGAADRPPPAAGPPPVMLQAASQPLLALTLAMAVYLFLRGHNLPGGGFVAGLLAALALFLQAIAWGGASAGRPAIDMSRTIGFGLLVAAATGIAAMAVGYPFLTSATVYLDWRPLDTIGLSSAAVFDLGIFLVVAGSLLMVLAGLGRVPSPAGAPSKASSGRAGEGAGEGAEPRPEPESA